MIKIRNVKKRLEFLFWIFLSFVIIMGAIMVRDVNDVKADVEQSGIQLSELKTQQKATSERIEALEIHTSNYATVQAKEPYKRDIPLSDELQEYTYQTAQKYNVDYDLILAIMQTESQFTNTISDNGEDIGLSQINVINAEWLYKEYGLYNLMDEHQNIEACAVILSKLSDKFDSENEVVMAYNLGEGKAQKYIKSGKITEYTEKVYKNMKEIKE